MSNRALTWAFEQPLQPGPKFVLVALADHAADHSGEDWTCFPSSARLVAMTGGSVATVERHLKWLWREGWISRVRRRRADGRLGIYDFTLHREAERRDALRAERAGVSSTGQAVDGVEELGGVHSAGPPVNLTCGEDGPPPVNLQATTRQNGASPPVNLRGQEPLGEPLSEPSDEGRGGRAREPGSEGFDEAVAGWPESGRKRTSWPRGRAAWAWACGQVEAERLAQAVARCAADPDLARGDHGWPALDRWLSEERWRAYLPAPGGGAAAAAGGVVWLGPAGLRAAVVAVRGEAFTTVALDKAGWDGAAVRPASPWAWRELGKPDLAGIFEQYGALLVGPDGVRA